MVGCVTESFVALRCIPSCLRQTTNCPHLCNTCFSVGRRRQPPEVGLRKKYYSARAHPDDQDLLEPLNLPPTKVEEKRDRLRRIYERREKKRMDAKMVDMKKKVGDESPKAFISEYDKNRLNNGKSHIEMPTCSSGILTSRSLQQRPPGATLRGTNK